MNKQTKILKVRIKDKHSKMPGHLAFGVNQVWNAVNDLSHDAYYVPVPEVGYIKGEWLSAYAIQKEHSRGRALPSGCRNPHALRLGRMSINY